jgi:hypothetical protein
MPKPKKGKISDADRPTPENNYLFDQRVERFREKRNCSLEEAENAVTEIIQRDHPDWNPPQPVKGSIEEVTSAITEEKASVGSPTATTKSGKKTSKKPTKAEDAAEGFLTTKDLANKYGITTVALRRVLREMPQYNDGTFTRYRWNGWDDPVIKLIDKAVDHADSTEEASEEETVIE